MAPSSEYKQLLALAWPIVLARATQSVIGFTDALLVAPLGESALAAVTTGALNTFSMVMLPMGTVFILQSFAAQLRGRGELGAARRYAYYGLVVAVLAGALAIAAIPLVAAVLARLDYAPDVRSAMQTYIAIRLLSVPFVVATEALGNWYGGLGNTRVAMVAGVVTMVTNVALCWLLIEPHLGLPGWGVAGSAWASVVASALGFATVASLFFRRAGTEEAPRVRLGDLTGTELLRVIRFGLPNGINWFVEFAAYSVFVNVVVAHLGTTTLAALNVVMQINSVSFMPAFGIASAGAILVGEAIGGREKDRVPAIVRRTALTACGWMLSIGLLYLLAPARLIGAFAPRDVPAEALVAVGSTMLVMSALWQIFDGLGMTFSEALRAAGDTTWSMGARVLLAWFVFTPLAYVLVVVRGGGEVAVVLSMCAYLGLVATALGARFLSGRWRSIDLVEEPKVV